MVTFDKAEGVEGQGSDWRAAGTLHRGGARHLSSKFELNC